MNWSQYREAHRLDALCEKYGIVLVPKGNDMMVLRLDATRYPKFSADNALFETESVDIMLAYIDGMFSYWQRDIHGGDK